MSFRLNAKLEIDKYRDLVPGISFSVSINAKHPPEFPDAEPFYEWLGNQFFGQLKKKYKHVKTWHLEGWTMEGRSGGWFTLIFRGDHIDLTNKQKEFIETLFLEYWYNMESYHKKYLSIQNKTA
jgi:hypothetical protein